MTLQVLGLGTTGKLAISEGMNMNTLIKNYKINRCECGNCTPMPTPTECVCCKEITAVVNKCESMDSSEPSTTQCIINHDGFDPVCLNIWVLQTAFFNYRHHYGTRDIRDNPTHE